MCSVVSPSNCVQKHKYKERAERKLPQLSFKTEQALQTQTPLFLKTREGQLSLSEAKKNALFLFSPPSTSKTFSSVSLPCPFLFTTVKISHFHSQDQTHDHHNPLSPPPIHLFLLRHQSEPKKPNPKSLFVRFKNSYNWLWQLWPIPRQDPHFSRPHSPCSLKIRPFSCSQIPWCLFLFGPS